MKGLPKYLQAYAEKVFFFFLFWALVLLLLLHSVFFNEFCDVASQCGNSPIGRYS
jgi:hypothetical protein